MCLSDPARLMDNVGAVTAYLKERVSDPRAALHFLPAKDGKFYHVDEQGQLWRMYDFVGGFCLDAPESDEDFYQSALAFGRFQEMLSDFPAETLYETIPEFHNTVYRYRRPSGRPWRQIPAAGRPCAGRTLTSSFSGRRAPVCCSACGSLGSFPCG
ncbi:MAG: hypothetical protein ACLU9S_11980 [Oscillospiraceae bacterium]